MKIIKSLSLVILVLLLGSGCATFSGSQKIIQEQLQAMGRGEPLDQAQLEKICGRGATAACALIGQAVENPKSLSIAQGYTDESKTNLTVLLQGKASPHYVVVHQGPKGLVFHSSLKVEKTARRQGSPWKVDHLGVQGLALNKDYQLWVIDETGSLVDRRTFRALDLKRANPRLAVISCMDDGFKKEQARSWARVRQTEPDLLFFLGDNVYADKYIGPVIEGADPSSLWRRYTETRNTLDVYHWDRLVPILATWDDHDYGKNDGDSRYRYKTDSQDIFFSFFAQVEQLPHWQRGPGVSGVLRAFGQRFVLLDGRTYRTPNRLNSPDQSHFGPEQEAWLSQILASGQEPVWLINGDQFFGGYHKFESYEGSHPQSFEKFKQSLRRLKVPIVFVSGDRHLNEILKIEKSAIGRTTYEITSSGIHARTFAAEDKLNPNPRRLEGVAGPYNFTEIIPSVVKGNLHLKVTAWGADEGALFRRELTIQKP